VKTELHINVLTAFSIMLSHTLQGATNSSSTRCLLKTGRGLTSLADLEKTLATTTAVSGFLLNLKIIILALLLLLLLVLLLSSSFIG